jgi:peptidoglycan/LPS O-acetylase OafA/YrhL
VDKIRNNHFELIDLLRAFAALSVVVYHVIEHTGWQAFPYNGVLSVFRVGWIGVDLFFVISGFVIGLSAYNAVERNGAWNFQSAFFKRRLLRIVPLYYFTLLVCIVFLQPNALFGNFWPDLLTHILFIHNFFLPFHGSINGSAWSLGTEMQFYILMLLIAPLLVSRWNAQVLMLLLIITWAWRATVYLLVDTDTPYGVFPIFIAATQLPGMLDLFAIGLGLALFAKSERFHQIHKKTSFRVTMTIVTLTLVLSSLHILRSNIAYWDDPWMVVFWRTLMGSAFGTLLLLAISFELKSTPKLIFKPFLYLGTISYGIYLWHLPVIISLKRVPNLSYEATLTTTLILTCILASASWHLFEKPIMQRK